LFLKVEVVFYTIAVKSINPIAYMKRYRLIVNVLLKYGFGYFLKELQLHSMLPFSKRIMRSKLGEEIGFPFPRKIRFALEELGVVSIKFGQFLSTRPDIITPELAKELEKLQDNVKPFEFEFVEERIKKEFDTPVSELFEWIDEQPLAAASIGQVHKARLKNGKTVIVKVQRPGVEENVEIDLAILLDLAKLAKKHISKIDVLDPVGLVEEFSRSLKRELDYVHEGRNAERFRKNFKAVDYVHIPKVFWDFTTKGILTMEFMEGIKINNIDKINKKKLDRKKIAENGAKAIMKQVLIDGFFHADPHPGNIFVSKNETITFMDFGMTGFIDTKTKQRFADLFISVTRQDADKTIECIFKIVKINEKTNIDAFREEISELIAEYYGVSLKQIKIGILINELMTLARSYRAVIPSNLLLLAKTLITIEGVGEKLNPDFNLAETAQPFAKQLLKKRLSPKRMVNVWIDNIFELNELAIDLPQRINRILQKMERGPLQMDLQHKGLEEFTSELNKSSNRIATSLITAALIVGSSLVIISDKGPFIFGMSAIGLVGFCFAALLGALLVVSMLRSGQF